MSCSSVVGVVCALYIYREYVLHFWLCILYFHEWFESWILNASNFPTHYIHIFAILHYIYILDIYFSKRIYFVGGDDDDDHDLMMMMLINSIFVYSLISHFVFRISHAVELCGVCMSQISKLKTQVSSLKSQAPSSHRSHISHQIISQHMIDNIIATCIILFCTIRVMCM